LLRRCALAGAALVLAGCSDLTQLPPQADMGAQPVLLAPVKQLVPTVNIAPAKGWPEGVLPQPMAGLRVTALARGLEHPRWVYVLPNGDVLVAESNKPAKASNAPFSLMGWIADRVMTRAGAGVASADRITLLRDVDGDGVAETRTVFFARPAFAFWHGAGG
jgi:glucose/arabinose dehydrogenase